MNSHNVVEIKKQIEESNVKKTFFNDNTYNTTFIEAKPNLNKLNNFYFKKIDPLIDKAKIKYKKSKF